MVIPVQNVLRIYILKGVKVNSNDNNISLDEKIVKVKVDVKMGKRFQLKVNVQTKEVGYEKIDNEDIIKVKHVDLTILVLTIKINIVIIKREMMNEDYGEKRDSYNLILGNAVKGDRIFKAFNPTVFKIKEVVFQV